MPSNYSVGYSTYGMMGLSLASPFGTAQSATASVGNGRQLAGGTVYFVSSVFGTDGNPGYKLSSNGVLATFGQALTLANAGDTIVLLPGHSETTTAAAGIKVNTSNLLVIGLGVGQLRPTFKYSTATSATFDVVKDNVTFYNVRWDMTGIASLVTGINVKTAANDVRFDTCEFVQSNGTNACATAILTDSTASGLVVNNCRFLGLTGTPTAVTNALNIVGGDRASITNNYFSNAYASATGAIQNVTTACTNTLVAGNVINNLTSSNTKAMVFASGSTGEISNNRMQILSGTAPITGAAMSWVGGNYYAASIATAGTLI